MTETTSPGPDSHHDSSTVAARAEGRWATFAIAILVFIVVLAAIGGIRHSTLPQYQAETIDPSLLHINGEFVESNLGSAVESDGSVTVRIVAQQYSFTPQCILVPADTSIVFRATSADAIHGFLIEGSNINSMLVPGYISSLPARFDRPGEHLMPCHEFCGVGHQAMWATVKVIDKAEFFKMSSNRRRLTCVD
jgi:cytochrome c oxidase subunit II